VTVQRAIPSLVNEDIPAAYDYLVRVFGFEPVEITNDDAGQPIHAELRAGDTQIYLHSVSEEFRVASPLTAGVDTAGLDVIVDDVDAHFDHARAEGATIVYPPADMPYGFREYGARDLEGRLWSFMQPLA
jgi:MerR family transcriptional regulator, thiopeptide resistance regulator